MSNVEICEKKNRGTFVETVIRDTTRVAHPVLAKIYALEDEYLIVPESDFYPVVMRDNYNAAVNFCEQLVSS